MKAAPLRLIGRGSALVIVAVSATMLAACSTSELKVENKKPTSSTKEYFAESEYGVKASPRVTNQRSRLPRGGGRDQLGKPYKVKGKWYTPKEVPNYRNAGLASWYGDAFHGRLTANGEIYDMTHLTAAHPTMPLPSYARVTNVSNGNSVIVRVNDRGPFAHGRVIDLSRRTAELLDFTTQGVARVEVEYVGRAPLHGQDDSFLMASYRPGGRGPDPSDGLPSGVMIAMNGPTPTAPAVASAFPGQLRSVTAPMATGSVPAFAPDGGLALPDQGPLVPPRPGIGLAAAPAAPLAYARQHVGRAAQALESLAGDGGTIGGARAGAGYVAVGTYADERLAQAMADALAAAGRAVIEPEGAGGFAVTLHPDGRLGPDDMLRAAWAAGASEAFPVRD
jgi:rare lipoprotein A